MASLPDKGLNSEYLNDGAPFQIHLSEFFPV